MSDIILLFGGNKPYTRQAFDRALVLIGHHVGKVRSLSGLYSSPPWGFEHPHWFLNQVVNLKSEITPETLLKKTQFIEKEVGRREKTRKGKYEARLIDVDILFIDNQVINRPELIVPHPRLHLRRFTLLPLNELFPGRWHPVLQKTVSELLGECPDEAEVHRVD